MGKTFSPLRYPGGKSATYPMISSIIQRTFSDPCNYFEPYAGGGGLALALLFSGDVERIYLNDLDRSIWCLWNSILNHTEEFISLIDKTPITLEQWHKQRNIQFNNSEYSDLQIGFSTFFLNRTNRSGIIIKAGVIGGLEQKNEKYKIDCRFNKVDLIKRVNKIASFKEKINIFNLDAVDFLSSMDKKYSERNCFFIDPPYYEKGSSLYTNFYNKSDHSSIANVIKSLRSRWILTYDNAPEIKGLYKENICYEYNLNYSLAKKRLGTELLLHNGMDIPDEFIGSKLFSV